MSLAVAAAHDFLRSRLRPGGCALDATAGRGRDTLFLARLVGPGGVVHACDVQSDALEETRRRWDEITGAKAALVLHHCGHERVAASLAAAGTTALDAIVFNLGYLPGGDPSLTTRPATTVAALASLVPLLNPGSAFTIVMYRRHPGAQEELDSVLSWAATLPFENAHVRYVQPLNHGPLRPHLVAGEIVRPLPPPTRSP